MNPTARSLTLCLSFTIAASAHATTIYVRTGAAPGGNGSSWSLAYDELRDALAVAASNGSITEIWVAKGTYRPDGTGNRFASFVLRSGLSVLGGFAGTEVTIDQRDPHLNPTLLSGDLNGDDGPAFANTIDNSYHVVLAPGGIAAATLDGFTISGGASDGTGGLGSNRGGGLLADFASLTVGRCRFERNHAVADGGSGGSIAMENGKLTLVDTTITDSEAIDGGGLQARESIVSLDGCSVQSNHSTVGAGVSLRTCTATITDTSFTQNVCTTGAGVAAMQAKIDVARCTFDENQATAGGGLYLRGEFAPSVPYTLSATVTDCTFTGNRGTSGFAIYVTDGSATSFLTIDRCRFLENRKSTTAGIGPKAALVAYGDTQASVRDSLFVNNHPTQIQIDGGSIAPVVDIDRCTVTSTSLTKFEIEAPAGFISMRSTIVHGVAIPITAGSAATVAAASSCVKLGWPGPGVINANPSFVAPTGTFGDFSLRAGSPCIDTGDDTTVSPLAVDLEGAPRRLDGDVNGAINVDMGALEHRPIQLDVTGSLTAGSNVVVDVAGVPATTLMIVGFAPGKTFLPTAGLLLFDVNAAWFTAAWPSAPSSVTVPITAPLPFGLTMIVQAYGTTGTAAFVSNAVELTTP